jgi:hypothetical protein
MSACVPDTKVLVGADLVEMIGEPAGERVQIEFVILPGGEADLDGRRGPFGDIGEDVIGAEQPERDGHGLTRGQVLIGEGVIVVQLDGRGAGVIEGELQQPCRRKPQRQLP